MTEQDAIDEIKAVCHSRDREANGCDLDRIVMKFLDDNGFRKLVAAMEDVECWRA